MKILFASFLLAFLFVSQLSQAQSFNLGSAELDLHLTNMNKSASLNLSLFKQELGSEYQTSSSRIDYLFSLRLQPAEVFLVLELGRLSGKSFDIVVKTYEAQRSQGWGAIAKSLGIKPGSPQFHALKDSARRKGNGHSKKGKSHPGKGKKH